MTTIIEKQLNALEDSLKAEKNARAERRMRELTEPDPVKEELDYLDKLIKMRSLRGPSVCGHLLGH
jgi:hypothetical protein